MEQFALSNLLLRALKGCAHEVSFSPGLMALSEEPGLWGAAKSDLQEGEPDGE